MDLPGLKGCRTRAAQRALRKEEVREPGDEHPYRYFFPLDATSAAGREFGMGSRHIPGRHSCENKRLPDKVATELQPPLAEPRLFPPSPCLLPSPVGRTTTCNSTKRNKCLEIESQSPKISPTGRRPVPSTPGFSGGRGRWSKRNPGAAPRCFGASAGRGLSLLSQGVDSAIDHHYSILLTYPTLSMEKPRRNARATGNTALIVCRSSWGKREISHIVLFLERPPDRPGFAFL